MVERQMTQSRNATDSLKINRNYHRDLNDDRSLTRVRQCQRLKNNFEKKNDRSHSSGGMTLRREGNLQV